MTTPTTNVEGDAAQKSGVHRLSNITTEEVSLVDRAANKRRFLIVKRADGTDEQVEVPAEVVKTESPVKKDEGSTATPTKESSMSATSTAPVEKSARTPNGDRLARVATLSKTFKSMLSDLKTGTVSVEKFDSLADGLNQIVSECDIQKFIESRAAVTKRAPGPAPTQPDTSEVVATMKRHETRFTEIESQNKKLNDEIQKRDQTIDGLKGEIVNLKKFREAPSSISDEEAVQLLKGEGSDPDEEVTWGIDMAADLESERSR